MTKHVRITPSTIALRMDIVEQRHKQISEQVVKEERKIIPDALTLQNLKRKKLRLKDILQRYEGLRNTLARGLVTT